MFCLSGPSPSIERGNECVNCSAALEKLKTDPRITVRLGPADDIRAFGSMAETRLGRQQIPHQVYKDPAGRCVFISKDPTGRPTHHTYTPTYTPCFQAALLETLQPATAWL